MAQETNWPRIWKIKSGTEYKNNTGYTKTEHQRGTVPCTSGYPTSTQDDPATAADEPGIPTAKTE